MTGDLSAAVRAAVGAVTDPELRRPLAELDMVRGVEVDGTVAHVHIALTIVGCPAADRISREVTDAAASVPGIDEVDLSVGVMTPAECQTLTERLRGGRSNVLVAVETSGYEGEDVANVRRVFGDRAWLAVELHLSLDDGLWLQSLRQARFALGILRDPGARGVDGRHRGP